MLVNPERWLLALCGVFSLACAVGDFDFFMGHAKAKFFVETFGRTGARIFYGLVGLLVMAAGLVPGAW